MPLQQNTFKHYLQYVFKDSGTKLFGVFTAFCGLIFTPGMYLWDILNPDEPITWWSTAKILGLVLLGIWIALLVGNWFYYRKYLNK